MDIVKGEPLKLPDGTIILPEADASGSKVVDVATQQENAAHEQITRELDEVLDADNVAEVSATKRTLADINVPFQQMNVYMLVAAYATWGLDDFAISRVLNVDIERVAATRESDTCARLRRDLVEAMRHAEEASVHGYLSAKSQAAARVVVNTLTAPNGDLRLAAAKDILDRSGFRPADRVEHVMRFEDELRIRYIQEDAIIPTIDIDIEN